MTGFICSLLIKKVNVELDYMFRFSDTIVEDKHLIIFKAQVAY